jgi:hypothetical protein
VLITSLRARGSSASLGSRGLPLERVDRLSRIAWITSLRARGWPPSERVDRLPWSAWIASLGAHGWTPLESSLGMPGSPPFHLVDVSWIALMYYDHCDCMLSSGDTCAGPTQKYVHKIGHDCETKSGLESTPPATVSLSLMMMSFICSFRNKN